MNPKFSIGDPIPATIEIEYADSRAHSRCWGDYSVVGASVRGRLHNRNGVPREDAFAVRSNSAWLVAAVSDGVGSRPYSRFGASYAVNRLCARLFHSMARFKPDDLGGLVRRGFCHTRADLEQFACNNKIELNELPCTLLGLVLNAEAGILAVGQIGDGLILGLTNDGTAEPLINTAIPDDLGSTYVLTQDNWEQYLRLSCMEEEGTQRFRTFYLMTDGVADDCQYGPPADIMQRWAIDVDREIRLFAEPRITARRLRNYLETYEAKGSFDDRTIVVLFRQ